MQPIWNPAENFLQGLSVAQRIRDTMARQQLEQRQLALAEREQERAREARGVQLLSELLNKARPVSSDGTVTERTQLNMQASGVPPAIRPGPVDVVNTRPADAGHTVAFEGRQFEFLKPEDLEARRLEEGRRAGEQQNALALERFGGQAQITDTFREKDRDLQRELAEGRITAQQAIAEMAQRARAEQMQQQQAFQGQLEQMRQSFQAGENTKNREAQLRAAATRAAGSAARGESARSVGVENALRDDFRQQTGEFQKVARAYNRVLAASKDGANGVNDVALLYGYMKMLDPGSVVREGEFATAQNSAGVPDRVRTMVNNAINGAKLSPQQRAEMLAQSGEVYSRAKAEYDALSKSFSDAAARRGGDPRNVVMDLGLPQVPAAPRAAGGGMVRLQAPDGSVREVPADAAEHYLKLGAKRVQ